MRPWTRFVSTVVAVAVATSVLSPIALAQTTQPSQPGSRPEPTGAEVAGSVAANVFYAPGKFFTCLGGGVLWVVSMAVTFGTMYDDGARLLEGACGGRWTLDDADIREATKPVPNSSRAPQN